MDDSNDEPQADTGSDAQPFNGLDDTFDIPNANEPKNDDAGDIGDILGNLDAGSNVAKGSDTMGKNAQAQAKAQEGITGNKAGSENQSGNDDTFDDGEGFEGAALDL